MAGVVAGVLTRVPLGRMCKAAEGKVCRRRIGVEGFADGRATQIRICKAVPAEMGAADRFRLSGIFTIDTACKSACASLFDALSLAVAYPSETLIGAWRNGEFIAVIEAALAQLPAQANAYQASVDLVAGLQTYFSSDRKNEDVQADYVGLFELNREQPPVRLLQHLYNRESHITQVDLYKALQERYRSCGITLKQGEGAVPPDQLSVQLEFMAYLFGQLSRANAGYDVDRWQSMLTDTAKMLHWIDGPIECLARAEVQHPLYLPLLRMLRDSLDLCATSATDGD